MAQAPLDGIHDASALDDGVRGEPDDWGSLRSSSVSSRVEAYAHDGPTESAEHAVCFYRSDAELRASVSDFIRSGLRRGSPLVVVTTREHERDVRADLAEEAGLLDDALAHGKLHFVDARAALAEIMDGDRPDRSRFFETVGAVFEDVCAAHPGSPVMAHGELVDLLWQAGNGAAAIELDGLWGDLQSRTPFSLSCALALGTFHDQPRGLVDACAAHGSMHPLGPEAGLESLTDGASPSQFAQALATEIARRKQTEEELLGALNEAHEHEAALAESQRQLCVITDALPALVSYVDAHGRYRFANQAYERWFGISRDEIIGQRVLDVVGREAYSAIGDAVAQALAGRRVTIQRQVPYRHGGERFVDITYIPHASFRGTVHGFVALISDISESKRAEAAREAASGRAERLMRVTAAIAEAVEPEQVLEAVVDRVAAALGASSAGLWLLADGGEALLSAVRAVGYSEALWRALEPGSSDAPPLPARDAVRRNVPIWLSSRREIEQAYPELARLSGLEGASSLACLPLGSRGTPRGAITFAFADERTSDPAERDFLLLVARYAGQAVERLRLLETERALYEANEQGRVRAELLYELAAAVIRARTVEEVFDAALDGIERALGASRSSILTFDADGVMRFKAWRGLSERYRAAVEGHSPWNRQAENPRPIIVPDVLADADLRVFSELFQSEAIGALGFIPLVSEGRLIGKFMVYYPSPRELSATELDMGSAIANHVAAAIGRFSALSELEETVRFNEIFTGMLGHDLRNPLGAIMAAAQIAVRRSEGAGLDKPLARILKSGERMATMIDQLLDFTRVRVGAGIPIDPRAADVATVMRQAVDELSDTHADWSFTFDRDGDTQGVWDADRILQVFSNLVANAVQHGSREHGVRVRMGGSDPEVVSVVIHNMGAVPLELLPRLFEPMAGGDRRRSNSRGLGLGLYISREIVKAHGGEIHVDTSPEGGTTFSVRLPRVARAPEGPRP
jgi:PAS domain S-box-containing protein